MSIFTAVKYCCILHGRIFVMSVAIKIHFSHLRTNDSINSGLVRMHVTPHDNHISLTIFTLDLIGIRLYRQIVGFPMGTICAPLQPICFYLLRHFMMSLSDDKHVDIIVTFY